MLQPLIVGAAEVPYTRHAASTTTTLSLLAQAGRLALADADLAPSEIDGLGVSSFTLRPDHSIDLAWRLGLSARWLMDSSLGGASGLHLLQHARRALQAEDADTILLLSGDRLDAPDFRTLVENYNSATRDHLRTLPFGGPNSLFALLTQRHMGSTGATRADYGRLVVAQRQWASRNPDAVYTAPLTLEQYLTAPIIAEPLCRYDCAPVVSGANAIVISSKGGKRTGIAIKALHSSHNPDNQEGNGLTTGLTDIRDLLWKESGRSPQDIDVLSVYDDYPAMVRHSTRGSRFLHIAELRLAY